MQTRNRRRTWGLLLGIALLVALGLRLLLWNHLPRTGLISDEGEYIAAATWLAQGRNFSWYFGYLWTRAPLYPLFVAAHFALFGQTLAPIYISQIILSLINVVLVFALALRITSSLSQTASSSSVAFLAALLMGLYFPFAVYTQVLLSETLYLSMLLAGFVALAWASDATRLRLLVLVALAGALLGLSTLTRSLTLAFLPVATLWLLVGYARSLRLRVLWETARHNWSAAGVFLAAALVVILPWTAYNSARYGGLIVVDTTGAYNLMLGGRTAYDGTRQDAPPRNFALALLDPQLLPRDRTALIGVPLASGGACLYDTHDPRLVAALNREAGAIVPQGQVQQLMTAEGLCLIGKRPLAFAQKTAGELLDFFQINYSGDERFSHGFALGRLPPPYTLGLFLLDDTLYVLVLPLAVLGMARALATLKQRPGLSIALLIAAWWLFNIVVAPLLFAINRFRLPLLPFAFIFAAYALADLPRVGRSWWRTRAGIASGVVALLVVLVSATPYAYFEPRAANEPSRWASYLGPYPSSISSSALALQRRGDFEQQETMRVALRSGDAAAVKATRPAIIRLERAGKTVASDEQIADALLAGIDNRAEQGLNILPDQNAIVNGRDVEAAVVRGDLLRSVGKASEANALLTEQFVDLANPVEWAWDWLHPIKTDTINFGGNLDIGYIRGCYLGEGEKDANYRWCTDGAQMRFPEAGTGAPQTLHLRVDGRAWKNYAPDAPPVRILINGSEIGSFQASLQAPNEVEVKLPPTARGADIVLTLRTPTFVPPADDFNRQQGVLAGEGRQLGVRIDWAELR